MIYVFFKIAAKLVISPHSTQQIGNIYFMHASFCHIYIAIEHASAFDASRYDRNQAKWDTKIT